MLKLCPVLSYPPVTKTVESSSTVKEFPPIAVGKFPVNDWLTTPTVAEAFRDPTAAWIIVCPTVTAVASPVLLIVATPEENEVQVAAEVRLRLLPSE